MSSSGSSNKPITESNEYKTLTKVLQILEQQRETVLKDKETLLNFYNDAISQPIEFIEKLVGGNLKLPGKIIIESLPDFSIRIQSTEVVSNGNNSNSSNNSSSNSKPSNNNGIKSSKSLGTGELVNVNSSKHIKSNGNGNGNGNGSKMKSSSSKHSINSTVNQAWSEKEHETLVKLLVKYPEEEIAQKRWNKIAGQLGNRTPKQVASRTQKYFKKLESQGLPIPGSQGYLKSLNKDSNGKRKLKVNDYEHKSKIHKPNSNPSLKATTSTTAGSLSSSTTTSIFKDDDNGVVIHEGFKCDGCSIEPIIGVRWRCEECIEEFDLCEDCKNNYDSIGSHTSSHHMTSFLRAINAESSTYYIDTDYKFSYQDRESNYLDPNYDH